MSLIKQLVFPTQSYSRRDRESCLKAVLQEAIEVVVYGAAAALVLTKYHDSWLAAQLLAFPPASEEGSNDRKDTDTSNVVTIPDFEF